MSSKTLESKLQSHPEIKLFDVMKLVKLLASPILVAKSKSHADRVIVITDRTLRTGDYLAVIIETAQDGENIASVVSINPREQNNIIKWINEGLVIRQDIKKS